jgi:hypothetical protein
VPNSFIPFDYILNNLLGGRKMNSGNSSIFPEVDIRINHQWMESADSGGMAVL